MQPTALLHGHVACFNGSNNRLAGTVTDYLCDGVARGAGVLVVAKSSRNRALKREMSARGLDPQKATGEGRLMFLDAEQALARFLDGSIPNRERFDDAI